MRTRRKSAQAMVELAIAMPVLLWFALGTLDFGRVFYAYMEITNSAREGARRATLLPHVCDSTSQGISERSQVLNALTEQSVLFPPFNVVDPADWAVQMFVQFPSTSVSPPANDKLIVVVLDCTRNDRRTVTVGYCDPNSKHNYGYPFQPLTPWMREMLRQAAVRRGATNACDSGIDANGVVRLNARATLPLVSQ